MKIVALVLVTLLMKIASAAAADRFEFVAMGDMPYRLPEDYARVDRLIAAINASRPAFTIHVGDIKSGSTPCSDEILQKSFDQLTQIQSALIFTPGDNEWTDCHRENNGKYDPRERLGKIRQLFFPNPGRSLGKAPISVESQAIVMKERFATFVENARFMHNGVMIVTVHVVGSNNGFEPREEAAATEFFARDRANIAWLDNSFAEASARGAKAMVIAMQGNVYDLKQEFPSIPSGSGYLATIRAIERGSRSFDRPILFVHGDEHKFVVDRMLGTNLKPIPKTLRLQVYGANQVHAVRVLVDPASPGVFGFVPLIVPENGDY